MIKDCNCSHAYQDQKYGKGKRVHNKGGGGKVQDVRWVCTVCGAKK